MNADMLVNVLELGPLQTNTYVVSSKKNRQAYIIDPAWDAHQIIKFVESKYLEPLMVILTHAHADHIGAVDPICKKYGIRFAAHKDAFRMLASSELNLSKSFGSEIAVDSPSVVIDESSAFTLGNANINIIETPGHAPGGISVYIPGAVFTGDTLFEGSIGRYDLPGSNPKMLADSLIKLLKLPDETAVYPGHGPATTIGAEKKGNVYLEELLGK